MLKSSWRDYSHEYILVKGPISSGNTLVTDAVTKNKKVIFEKCAPLTDSINNTQVDKTKDIDVAMLMYNLVEYSHEYSKTSGNLWQYCRDEPALNNFEIAEFNADNATTDSFKLKQKITG